jgi:hypothetical protein
MEDVISGFFPGIFAQVVSTPYSMHLDGVVCGEGGGVKVRDQQCHDLLLLDPVCFTTLLTSGEVLFLANIVGDL